MTIKELIETLNTYDPDFEVLVWGNGDSDQKIGYVQGTEYTHRDNNNVLIVGGEEV